MDKLRPKTFYQYLIRDKSNWLLIGFLVAIGFIPGILLIAYSNYLRWFWFLLSLGVSIFWFFGELISFRKYSKFKDQ